MQRENSSLFVEQLLDQAFAQSRMSAMDQRLTQELVYGVIRHLAPLDWLIERKTHGRKQPTPVLTLLRLGLYQLFWMDGIPAHAAIFETVEIVKQFGAAGQVRFTNAILRTCHRERDSIFKLLAELKRDKPWFGYSHPEWLYHRWDHRWGAAATLQLMQWNNTPPKTCARINLLKTTPGRLSARWHEEDVVFRPIHRDWIPPDEVFELKSHPPLRQMDSFTQGFFYVQDPATLLAVHALDPKPGETLLDACAAPGGKSALIAQRMANRGNLIAHDVSGKRLHLVRENCARLGVTCVRITPDLSSLEVASFDRILVDAPCSNTGVMRRRVELRWRLRLKEIDGLKQTQLEILRRVSPLLKPGGVLLYSTCSLEPEENEAVADELLETIPGFKREFQRTLLPFKEEVDGAFVCRLRKSGNPLSTKDRQVP